MKKDIVITEGLFSKLTIALNEDAIQKLAFIPKKDNPLANVEQKMKEILNEFEIAYFDYTHKKKEAPDLHGNDAKAPSEPPTEAKASSGADHA